MTSPPIIDSINFECWSDVSVKKKLELEHEQSSHNHDFSLYTNLCLWVRLCSQENDEGDDDDNGHHHEILVVIDVILIISMITMITMIRRQVLPEASPWRRLSLSSPLLMERRRSPSRSRFTIVIIAIGIIISIITTTINIINITIVIIVITTTFLIVFLIPMINLVTLIITSTTDSVSRWRTIGGGGLLTTLSVLFLNLLLLIIITKLQTTILFGKTCKTPTTVFGQKHSFWTPPRSEMIKGAQSPLLGFSKSSLSKHENDLLFIPILGGEQREERGGVRPLHQKMAHSWSLCHLFRIQCLSGLFEFLGLPFISLEFTYTYPCQEPYYTIKKLSSWPSLIESTLRC